MDLVVADTRNGKGVVASRAFTMGETVFEVTGIFITGDVDEDIPDLVRDNAFRFSEDLYISPNGSMGDFLNHSCFPNAKIEKIGERLFVVALHDIAPGDEVLIDYSTIVGADDVWEMDCNCGAEVCRGVIRSFDTLSEPLRERYVQRGMVPPYIVSAQKPDLV
jgi:hypothetical protein